MSDFRVYELEKVESDLIAKIGYDEETQTLFVEFPKSKKQTANPVYSYAPFPKERFDEFKASMRSETNPEGSIGKYFLQKIKTDKSLTVTKLPIEEQSETA